MNYQCIRLVTTVPKFNEQDYVFYKLFIINIKF